MAAIYRVVKNVGKQILLQPNSRMMSSFVPQHHVKIVERKEGNDLIIEAIKVDPAKDPLLIKNDSGACPLCALGINLKHTDVLILQQFLRPDGCMLPRRVTGLCNTQQKRVTTMVAMAQKAGILLKRHSETRVVNPERRKDWKKFHTYYDENTIVYKLH